MTDMKELSEGEKPFHGLEAIGSTPVAPAHAIAAVALNMAMKYHDMGMIKDGQLYQQYKLEGRNITTLHLAEVFETAMKIEAWLLGASERIASIVVDAITMAAEDDGGEQPSKDGPLTEDRPPESR